MHDDVFSKICRDHSSALFNYLTPKKKLTACEWVEANIDFAKPDSRIPKTLDLSFTPYMLEPFEYVGGYEGGGHRQMTIVAVEQLGKTTLAYSSLLNLLDTQSVDSWVIYRSDEFAADMNRDKLEPLIEKIPNLKRLLDLPRSRKAGFYQLGDCQIQFSGSDNVRGKSVPVMVADEIDSWIVHAKEAHPLDAVRHRIRSFDDGLIVVVCSPRGSANESKVWREFAGDGKAQPPSSMGYWHLRCARCLNLTIRSCDIHHLEKGELDSSGMIAPSNIRLVCPGCGNKHREDEKAWMNQNGAYVHKHPDRKEDHAGFQIGALASRFAGLSWSKIIEQVLRSGRTAGIETHIAFDNSWRGLPYVQRTKVSTDYDVIKKAHCVDEPKAEDILATLMSIDSQQASFVYVVRAFLRNGNSHLLKWGEVDTFEEVRNIYCNTLFFDTIPILAGIWDEGGNRSVRVQRMIRDLERYGMYSYKGNSHLKGSNDFKVSEEWDHRILARPLVYQTTLLQRIYQVLDQDQKGFWGLPRKIDSGYIDQIACMVPPRGKKDAPYSKWTDNNQTNDYFDAEKMWLVLFDFLVANLKPKQWKLGNPDSHNS